MVSPSGKKHPRQTAGLARISAERGRGAEGGSREKWKEIRAAGQAVKADRSVIAEDLSGLAAFAPPFRGFGHD